jgi:bisphosphoglycerate-dependent phosphoglycerate mutase family 1
MTFVPVGIGARQAAWPNGFAQPAADAARPERVEREESFHRLGRPGPVLAACGRDSIPVRRSYDAAPPPLAVDASRPGAAHYPPLRPEDEPRSESLRDVTARLLPYWHDAVVPDLRTGACVLIVSHGNTLRALIKYLDRIGDGEIAALDIPNGIPLLYRLGADARPLVRGGSYLAG